MWAIENIKYSFLVSGAPLVSRVSRALFKFTAGLIRILVLFDGGSLSRIYGMYFRVKVELHLCLREHLIDSVYFFKRKNYQINTKYLWVQAAIFL